MGSFNDARGRLTGKPRKPRSSPEFKTCARCHDEKPAATFSPCKKSSDGLHTWCTPCRAADQREKRRIARGELTPEEVGLRKLRISPSTMAARLSALLRASREARTAGCWRGREAIRAYRNLGEAIEAFQVEAVEAREAMEPDAHPCTCHVSPFDCRRHADVIAAYLNTHPEAA